MLINLVDTQIFNTNINVFGLKNVIQFPKIVARFTHVRSNKYFYSRP